MVAETAVLPPPCAETDAGRDRQSEAGHRLQGGALGLQEQDALHHGCDQGGAEVGHSLATHPCPPSALTQGLQTLPPLDSCTRLSVMSVWQGLTFHRLPTLIFYLLTFCLRAPWSCPTYQHVTGTPSIGPNQTSFILNTSSLG